VLLFRLPVGERLDPRPDHFLLLGAGISPLGGEHLRLAKNWEDEEGPGPDQPQLSRTFLGLDVLLRFSPKIFFIF